MTAFTLIFLLLPRADIDMPATVAPLNRLLPQLGERANMKLLADPSVSSDVVGIASPKRPVRELMDGIAEAANAEWEERRDTWVLLRSHKKQEEDQAKDVAQRAAWMRAALARQQATEPFDATRAEGLAAYRYQLKSQKEMSTNQSGQLALMNARSPSGRFTARLLEAIGVDDLAKIPACKRILLSTRPTKMEVGLKMEKLRPIIDQFRTEQNLYAAAVKAKGEPSDANGGMTYVSGFDFVQEIPATFDRFIIKMDTMNLVQTFFYVRFVDASGKILLMVPCALNRYDFSIRPPAETNTPLIEFSTQTNDIMTAMKRSQDLTDELRKPFNDPAVREPLAFVNQDAIASWSKFKDKPVIGLLSDINLAAFAVPDAYRVSQYQSMLEFFSEVKTSDKRIVFRPLDPGAAHSNRVSRTALSAYIASYRKAGHATLDALLKLAGAMTQPFRDNTAPFLQMAISGPGETRQMGLLHVVAIGPPSQQQALMAGGSLRFGDMSPAQQTWTTELMYNSSDLTTTMGGNREENRSIGNSILQEVAEFYPNGLPADVSLTTEAAEGEAVRVKAPTHTYSVLGETLASMMMGSGDQLPKLFQYGRMKSLNMTCILNERKSLQELHQEEQIDRAQPWVAYDGLPEAFRRAVDAKVAEYRSRSGKPPVWRRK